MSLNHKQKLNPKYCLWLKTVELGIWPGIKLYNNFKSLVLVGLSLSYWTTRLNLVAVLVFFILHNFVFMHQENNCYTVNDSRSTPITPVSPRFYTNGFSNFIHYTKRVMPSLRWTLAIKLHPQHYRTFKQNISKISNE